MSEVEVEAVQNLPESSSQESAKVNEETEQDEVSEDVKVSAQVVSHTEDGNDDKREETLTEVRGDTNAYKKDREPLTEANGTENSTPLDQENQAPVAETKVTESIATGDKYDNEPPTETKTKEDAPEGGKKEEQLSAVTNAKEDGTVGNKDEESLNKSDATEGDKTNGQHTTGGKVSSEKKHPESGTQKGEYGRRKPESYRDRINRQTKGNIKFDASSLEISSDPEEIRKQVEFYFSDSNLPMDKFLLGKVGGTSNHPVDIKLIHNFKRMRHFQPYSAVVEALKDSQFLEVTDGEKVRRRIPLSEETLGADAREGRRMWEDKSLDRSIYAKGFDEETPTTQFEIEAFFAPYGPTNAIRLRRTIDNIFKCSVFVEFADEATQQAFLALEPKPKWKGKDLLIKSKKDYVDGKAADIAAGRIQPKPKPRFPSNNNHNNNNRGIDQNDWKKRREEDQKQGFRNDRGRGGHGHGDGRGRGNDRGRGRGRGDRGRGRGGRGGRNFRERDPHKVPEIQTSTPESAGEVPIKKSVNQAKISNSQPSKTTLDTNNNNADTTTEVKLNIPPTTNNHHAEEISSKKPQLETTTNTTAPTAAGVEGMNLDPTAGKKRAREHDDVGHEGVEKREGTPTKKVKVEADGNVKAEQKEEVAG